MKIAFLRYPIALYKNGKIIRGGTEVVNQLLVDFLRRNQIRVDEYYPTDTRRLELISIPGVGTPLMFQELYGRLAEINSHDLVINTNWFGAIFPEISIPQLMIFHSNALAVKQSVMRENIEDKVVLDKWLDQLNPLGIGLKSPQSLHEDTIAAEEKYFSEKLDHLVAVSNYIRDCLVDLYGTPDNKITVINNPYPRDWADRPIKKDYFHDLSVISVTRAPDDYNGIVGKGLHRLFETFSQIKNKKVMVASTNSVTLPKFIGENFDDIHVRLNASRDKVFDELAKTHISLHCSRCEASSMTLVEAMLLQNVPITFNVGIAQDLIQNGQNGFIVNNVKEAINKVKFLEQNRHEAERMSLNARETVLKKLDPDKIGKQYLDVIRKVTQK